MINATSVAAQGDLLPMSVDKMGFLIDKLFDDCAPLQFVRELTKNSVESITRLPNSTGEIRWDIDWTRFDLTKEQEIIKRFNLGGLTCVSYLLAQSSFRLQSEWEVAGGIIKRL
jgi:hypothetical protein